MKELHKFYKSSKTVIMSSFADLLKSKKEQKQTDNPTKPILHSKEKLESKNIGQSSKNETREERKKRLERLYL